MAPAASTPAAATRNPSGQTISIPAPAQGAALAVPSSPGGELDLAFDPSTATAARQGDSLVFEVDGGGTVTISDFFVVGDESLPSLRLPDGTVVASADFFAGSDLDMTTAAGPAAGAPGSGGTSYDDGTGALLGGVDRLGSLGTDYWSGSEGTAEALSAIPVPDLTFGVGLPGGLADALTQNMNESDQGSALNLAFTLPLITPVTLVFAVGGNADALSKSGMEEFRADYFIDAAKAMGCTAVFNADAGALTLTIPAGTQYASVPVSFLDDHISDGVKSITFTLSEAIGNITAPVGGVIATIVISDDSGAHAHNPNNPYETNALDGPIVGLSNAGPNALYEAHPETNEFRFALTFTDPHSGEAYKGYTGRSGQSDFTLSQDMTITLEPGGEAGHGFDYEFDFREIENLPGVKSVSVDDGGRITIELLGRVDENGAPHVPPVTPYTFVEGQELVVIARVLVNNDGTSPEQFQDGGDEGLSLHVAGTSGNESQWNPAPVEVVIAEDPVLSIDLTAPGAADQTINESAKEFSLLLTFDKDIAADAEVTVVLELNAHGAHPLASLWNSAAVPALQQKYLGDFGLPAGATVVADESGNLRITFRGEDINGDGLTLTFPLIDDHITEGTEAVTFTVQSVTIEDARNEPAGHDHAPGAVGGAGDSDYVIITDDVKDTTDAVKDPGEKDGPVVGIVGKVIETINAEESVLPGESGIAEGANRHFSFSILLKDPYSYDEDNPDESADYKGFENDGLLSQTMTLTLTIPQPEGGATLGVDYTLDLSALDGIPGLAYSGPTPQEGGSHTITITLNGRVNADGDPYENASHETFNLNSLGDLVITATVVNDTITEVAETIAISVATDGGNESSGGGTAEVSLEKDSWENINGPIVHMTVTGDGGVTNKINESASTIDPAAPEDNESGVIAIALKNAAGEPLTADEGIPMTITLGGGSATYGPGNPSGNEELSSSVDYYLTGEWTAKSGETGTYTRTFTATGPDGAQEVVTVTRVDGENGATLTFTMPSGCTDLNIPFAANDDLFETENDSFGVTLSLDQKGSTGLAYGEAQLAKPDGDRSLTGKTETVEIIDDARDGALNPESFDGPWVSIGLTGVNGARDVSTVKETGGNKVNFAINLTNPDPASSTPFAAQENITLSLKLTGDISFHDLFAPQGNIQHDPATYGEISYSYSDDGGATFTSGSVAINQDLTFSLTIPKYATGLTFDVPINDDPLGGLASSALDKPSEIFQVEITGVSGNEARVDVDNGAHKSGTVTITDDPAGGALDGIFVGLDWGGSYQDSGDGKPGGNITNVKPNTAISEEGNRVDVVFEGKTYPIKITLGAFGKDGKTIETLSATNNPYHGYTAGNGLPEAMSVTFTFNPTGTTGDAAGKDMALSLGSALKTLVSNGTVTITYMDNGALKFLGANDPLPAGEFTLTIRAGANIVGIRDSLVFDATITADNINEWDNRASYNEGGKGAGEKWGLAVTGVSGNEGQLGSKLGLEAQISDSADGALSWIPYTVKDGAGKDVPNNLDENGNWKFGLQVKYPDNEGSLKTPGETVTLMMVVKDGVAMHNGEEYEATAYRMFLSMNKGNAALEALQQDGTVADEQSYADWLAGNPDAAAQGLIIVRETQSYSEGETHFQVDVPPSSWSGSGTLEWTVERGDNVGAQGKDAGFTIGLKDPYAAGSDKSWDTGGEIVTTPGESPPASTGDRITLSLAGTPTIYEDASMGDTTHDYTIRFDSTLYDNTKTWTAAGDITFNLDFIPGAGMRFDANLADNYAPGHNGEAGYENYNETGDVAVNLPGYDPYTSLNGPEGTSLLNQLNHWFKQQATDGEPPVTVNSITDNSGMLTFNLTAPEGYNLAKGVTIGFKALDDSVSDSGERFTLKISSVTTKTGAAGDTVNAGIAADNQSTTTVLDESGGGNGPLDGFAISLGQGTGHEVGEGADRYIDVPVYAFIIDNNSHAPKSLESLVAVYNAFSGEGVSVNDLYGDAMRPDILTAFMTFVQKTYCPAEGIKVTYTLGDSHKAEAERDDTAISGRDYMNSGSHSIPKEAWVAEMDEAGNICFKTKPGQGIQVETIADHFTEHDETLTITLKTTQGNETRPLTQEDKNSLEGNEAAKADYHVDESTVIIQDTVDGYTLLSFEAGYMTEPIVLEHGDGVDAEITQSSVHTIRLSGAVSEPVMIWMDLNKGDGVEGTDGNPGAFSDVYLGEDVYFYDAAADKVYSFDGKGGVKDEGSLKDFWNATFEPESYDAAADKYLTTPDGNKYFTFIKAGDSVADFTVHVRHDNDSAANERGGDKTDEEGFSFTITDIEGSEVLGRNGQPVSAGNGLTSALPDGSEAVIVDDGYGPEISYTYAGSSGRGTVTVTMAGPASEDVTLTLELAPADAGGEHTPMPPIVITIGKGETTATYDLPDIPADHYLSVNTLEGGEARDAGGVLFVQGPRVPGHDLDLTDIRASGITEGAYGKGGDTVNYELDFELPSAQDYPVSNITGDITFTLQVKEGTAKFSEDLINTGGLRVTIPKDFLDSLDQKLPQSAEANGYRPFTLTLSDDGQGGAKVVLVHEGSAEPIDVTGLVTVTGEFPAALGDAALEGDEHFHTVVIDASQGLDRHAGAASTTVEDATEAKLVFLYTDAQGKTQLLDGQDFLEGTDKVINVTAKLVLIDGNGNFLDKNGDVIDTSAEGFTADTLTGVTVSDPIEFTIAYGGASRTGGHENDPDYHAEFGADYSGDHVIRIEAGKDSGKLQLVIHDDRFTENSERFTVSAEVSETYKEMFPDIANSIKTGDPALVTIKDTEPWMDIKLEMGSKVTEGGDYSVNFSSWNGEYRQVVEETVELTFAITPQGGMAFGDDIASITVLDNVYVFNADGTVTRQKNGNDKVSLSYDPDTGVYTLVTVMEKGEALGGFSIKTKNDVLSEDEDGEAFHIKLVNVHGSEAKGGGEDTVMIEDDMNGFDVSVQPVGGNEEDGATFRFSFGGENKESPQEDVTLTITLDADARKIFDESGDIVVTLPGGAALDSGKIAYNNGKITLTLPAGMAAGDLDITFPVLDNSIKGSANDFGFSFTVEGGEMGAVGMPGYTAAFAGEQASDGVHGGYNFFTVDIKGGDSLDGVTGDMLFTVSGVKAGTVQSIIVDGKAYTSDDWTITDTGAIRLAVPGLKEHYDEVRVVYDKSASAADLAYSKANASVSAAVDPESAAFGAVVTVTDETDGAYLDGPTFSLVLDATVTEGATLGGKLLVTMPGLPGDPDYNAGDQNTVEAMAITLQASQNPDGSYSKVTIGDIDYTPNKITGTFTVTLPKESAINVDGTITLPVSIAIPDNSLATNPDYTLTIVEVTGSEGEGRHYETHIIHETEGSATAAVVNEAFADQEGVRFSITDVSAAANGEAASFTLAAAQLGLLTDGTTDAKLPEDVGVTLFFSGGTPGALLYVDGTQVGSFNNGYACTWTVSVEQGTDMRGYAENHSVFVVDPETGQGQGAYLTIMVTGVTPLGGADASSWELYNTGADSLSVTTDDYYHMAAGATGNYRNDPNNVVVIGTDGDDTIYGGAGNDTIYGGDGNDVIHAGGGGGEIYGGAGNDLIHAGTGIDILNGGRGDDIFIWTTGNLNLDNNADIIRDFDYSNDGSGGGDRISLAFSDIFGPGDDLKALLDNISPEENWDDGNKILTLSEGVSTLKATFQPGGDLLLTVTENENDVPQEIVIQSDAFTSFTDITVAEAQEILTHILKITTD